MAKILSPLDEEWLKKVIENFDSNEPVALPTETVYGLAAPAEREKAVVRIYEIKERPHFNPLIVHVKEDWDLSQWATLGELEKKLITHFWPGPLSLLVPKKNISDLVTAGSTKIVLRAPSHPIFRKVLEKWGGPLVAPSANTSMRLSSTTAQAVAEDLGEKLQAVVDGGPCEWGVESTIVEVQGDQLVILREGAISKELLESKGFRVCMAATQKDVTPGSQLKHYSPQVPLFFYESQAEWAKHAAKEVLMLKVLKSDADDQIKGQNVECLAPDNDFKTAAAKLFDFLRLAQAQYREIHVLKTKDISLGRAINDRLLRASQR